MDEEIAKIPIQAPCSSQLRWVRQRHRMPSQKVPAWCSQQTDLSSALVYLFSAYFCFWHSVSPRTASSFDLQALFLDWKTRKDPSFCDYHRCHNAPTRLNILFVHLPLSKIITLVVVVVPCFLCVNFFFTVKTKVQRLHPQRCRVYHLTLAPSKV